MLLSKKTQRKAFFLTPILFLSTTIFISPSESFSASSVTPEKINTVFLPSSIRTENITQSYQPNIFTKLFSSVPKRERAVDDISVSFGHRHEYEDRFTILIGRSASGKSTYLRLLAMVEHPVSGNLFLNENEYSLRDTKEESSVSESLAERIHKDPKPIIIDSKPDCFDSRLSTLERILASVPEPRSIECRERFTDDEMNELKQCVAMKFCEVMGLKEEQYLSTPDDLTPSQQYLFGLVCACMESSFENISMNSDKVVKIPCPILLLDELLDKETYDVASKVGRALLSLTEMGGVVIAATHRPQHLTAAAKRTITLSSGRVLAVEYHN
mmetsp:Transcript_14824/g.22449  ORF Transcript_14824/g.22449 Transcript_14824/m.22449 type:complete len:328 (+) Transcript_14824:41-1024(+)